ncbi:exopolysaccharide biosynthesis polyprenyl glycosylphosphotransferase [bacterium AH-315-F03]|nr:exopolysaccharide biosynthesis polyprenyl glycosylphosphotransferase [bacterium AH-315-F03]
MPRFFKIQSGIALFALNLPLRLALTVGAFVCALYIWNESFQLKQLLELVTVSLVLRTLIRLQCGFTETVSENSDARLLLNNTKSEIKFVIGFITVIYLSDWAISKHITLTFLMLNSILQVIPLLAQQLIRHTKVNQQRRGSKSQTKALGLAAVSSGRTAVVFGTGSRGKWVVDMLTSNPYADITPIGFIDSNRSGMWSFRDVPLIGPVGALRRLILERQVDLVFIACEPDELQDSRDVFAIAEEMGAPICVLPHTYESKVGQCRVRTFNGQSTLVYSSETPEGLSTVTKDFADRIAAFVSLIVVSPILLASAVAVKLTSRGPVLFRQNRAGKNGAIFSMLKFRTMCVDAEEIMSELTAQNEMSGPVFKIKNDPRITPVGAFLRKYSIDELPQLFNVLRGEMSLVGPRPALPAEVAQYSPWQRRKLAVKPGLTCIWQVIGKPLCTILLIKSGSVRCVSLILSKSQL